MASADGILVKEDRVLGLRGSLLIVEILVSLSVLLALVDDRLIVEVNIKEQLRLILLENVGVLPSSTRLENA